VGTQELDSLNEVRKVIIDDEEWYITIEKLTHREIKSPSGKEVIQYDATLWKYLEE